MYVVYLLHTYVMLYVFDNCNIKPKFHYADLAAKLWTLSWTQIMSPTVMICVTDFLDLCPRQSPRTLSPTFLVHCNGLNSVRVTQTGLSRTCHGLCCKYLDMLRWFVSVTFVICVSDFH